ncbi:hypothetical protein N9D23_00470 [Rubripirellula sp.]|nr:hypothetical protein [Rubripirellula sp.]
MLVRAIAVHLGDAAQVPLGHAESEFRKLIYQVQEGLLVYLLRELENKHFLPEAAKLHV